MNNIGKKATCSARVIDFIINYGDDDSGPSLLPPLFFSYADTTNAASSSQVASTACE